MVTITLYTDYHEEEILPLYESVAWTLYAANPAGLRRAFAGSLAMVKASCMCRTCWCTPTIGAKASGTSYCKRLWTRIPTSGKSCC